MWRDWDAADRCQSRPLPCCRPGFTRSIESLAVLAGLTVLTFSNAHTHHRNAPAYPYMNYKARRELACLLMLPLLLLCAWCWL